MLCNFACRFSHVFPAAGIQRCIKISGRGLLLYLSHAGLETYMTSSNTARAEQSLYDIKAPRWLHMLSNRSRGTLMSYTDRMRADRMRAAPSCLAMVCRPFQPCIGLQS